MAKSNFSVKGEVLQKLKSLNHETIGKMADNLCIQPQTIRYHIENNTPTLVGMDWLIEIQRVLELDNIKDDILLN